MQNNKGKVLVTGGAGYIGATVCSALLDQGWTPVILDNLCNGHEGFTKGRIFYRGDIADRELLQRIFKEQGSIYATIHCAALIVVPESVSQPEQYYRENVSKSIDLFSSLRDLGCKRIIFSSSAAIYDGSSGGLVSEVSPLAPSSPYARTKYMMEMVLQDFCEAYDVRGIALRYFNPIGADPKFRTGSYVKAPTHLLGRLVTTAQNNDLTFELTGTDWPTRDGSGIRDFIHVWDLARAHVKAVEHFDNQVFADREKNYCVINLGTGSGVTVKEFVQAFEAVLGRSIKKRETGRRPGDVAGSFASAGEAKRLIGWQAELPIEDGIRSALEWAKRFFI